MGIERIEKYLNAEIENNVNLIEMELNKGLYIIEQIYSDHDAIDLTLLIGLIEIVQDTMIQIKSYSSDIHELNIQTKENLKDNIQLQACIKTCTYKLNDTSR